MIFKRIFSAVLRILLFFVALSGLLFVGVLIFIKTSPQFGQPPTDEDLSRIRNSPQYNGEVFTNTIKTETASIGKAMRTLSDMYKLENTVPPSPLPVNFSRHNSNVNDSTCVITWYGHSAFLLQIDGKRILIDPMLGDVAAPVSFGTERFPYEQPIPIEELTNIDAILLSHDHYDHLDYPTIMKFKNQVKHFFVPLGVGSHLKSWGIENDRITELDWWESVRFERIELTACPARHFSGRGVTDRNSTLWASWAIDGEHQSIYFSGDGGYGPHFKEIGERLGPFDFAMLECGQYNEAWGDIHMMPEESVQAGLDVQGKVLMPIHWGAFQLALHEWTDPILRFEQEADRLGASISHPIIGERIILGETTHQARWWENLNAQK